MSISEGFLQKSSHSLHDNCLEAGIFRKSSHSGWNGCLEAGIFRKSSHSCDGGCLEAGQFGQEVRVADTTQHSNPHRPVLAFTPAAWQDFITKIKAA